MAIEWHVYDAGKRHIATDGDELVAMVHVPEGAPIEMYQVDFFNGAYMTLESAKAEAEREVTRVRAIQKRAPETFSDNLVSILKNVVRSIEEQKAASA